MNATSDSWRGDQLSQFFAFNLQSSWNHKDNFNFLKTFKQIIQISSGIIKVPKELGKL